MTAIHDLAATPAFADALDRLEKAARAGAEQGNQDLMTLAVVWIVHPRANGPDDVIGSSAVIGEISDEALVFMAEIITDAAEVAGEATPIQPQRPH